MTFLDFSRRSTVAIRAGAMLAAALVLSACVTPPPRTVAVAPAAASAAAEGFSSIPNNGQSPEQTDRDRYECHMWAVQQTGVDPSRPDAPPAERVVVQPANPPGTRHGRRRDRRRDPGLDSRRAAQRRCRPGAGRGHRRRGRLRGRRECAGPGSAGPGRRSTSRPRSRSLPRGRGRTPTAARLTRLSAGPRLHRQLNAVDMNAMNTNRTMRAALMMATAVWRRAECRSAQEPKARPEAGIPAAARRAHPAPSRPCDLPAECARRARSWTGAGRSWMRATTMAVSTRR